jgi:hypothetical protein
VTNATSFGLLRPTQTAEKPSELPVQAPTEYKLVVNLETAKLLGLRLQQLADKLIE